MRRRLSRPRRGVPENCAGRLGPDRVGWRSRPFRQPGVGTIAQADAPTRLTGAARSNAVGSSLPAAHRVGSSPHRTRPSVGRSRASLGSAGHAPLFASHLGKCRLTIARRPRATSMRPSSLSSAIARWAVPTATVLATASSATVGSWSPGWRRPTRMSSRIASAICS